MADRKPLRSRMDALWGHVSEGARRLTERVSRRFTGDPDAPEEIDFSAPSVPYYADLAARFDLSRVILYMLLFVFVVVTLIAGRRVITYDNLYYLVKDIRSASLTVQSEADTLNYPVSAVTPDFAVFRGGLVIAGDQEITVLGASGKSTMRVNVTYSAPAVEASDKYFLTYSQGEPSFSVYNPFVRVYTETTEYPIYAAAVADNGSFCVVTRSRDYRSEVLLYNNDMKKIADSHLQGYVTDVCLNPSGTACGILSVAEQDGIFVTTVTIVRLSDRPARETLTLTDTYAGVCGFVSDDRLAVLTGDRLLILRPDGGVASEMTFAGEELSLCAVSSGRIGLLSRRTTDLSEQLLRVFDRNGRLVYTLTLHPDRTPTQLLFEGNILYIRAQDLLFRVSADGDQVTQLAISRDAVTLLPAPDGGVLVCGTAFAARKRASDFSAP